MPSLLLSVFLLFISFPALAIYKCESGGKISYSDLPCTDTQANSKTQRIAIPAAPPDSHIAQEKMMQDKKFLQVIEADRRKEKTSAEKERQRRYREQESKRKRCASLEQRARWAQENAVRTNIKNMSRERRKAQRATEKYELECGKEIPVMQ